MPEDLFRLCLAGLLSTPDRESEDDFDQVSRERYQMACERWVLGSNLRPEQHRWETMLAVRDNGLPLLTTLYGAWTLKTPTIADLDVVPDDARRVYVTKAEGQERWLFYPYAFGIFWALLYHETMEHLRQPAELWATLERHLTLATERVRHEHPGLDLDDAFFREQFLFALYERILGLHYDMAQNLTHYRMNISVRAELVPTECKERVAAFKEAIDWLLDHVTSELLRPTA